MLDTIPDWLWNLSSQIYNLDLSHNQLSGNLLGSLKFNLPASIDLSFNLLEGSLPLWTSVTNLYLRNNSFFRRNNNKNLLRNAAIVQLRSPHELFER